MSNNGNIMGVELNLNQEYIKASVEEIVKAGIIGALGDPADIVKSALDKTLNRKVDKDGKDTSCSWGTPYLQYMANKAVEKAVQECMQKYVGEHEEEFRQEILRQLSSKAFNRAVLISIQPKWVELIASGKKTAEIRNTRPNLHTPFKSYIYMTRINWAFGFLRRLGMKDLADRLMHATGKIIGEFVCDKIDAYDYEYCTHPEIGMDYDCGDNWFCIDDADLEKACLTYKEFRCYAGNKDVYGWHISDLKLYDRPKPLSEFRKPIEDLLGWNGEITRPPQSWCYVSELPEPPDHFGGIPKMEEPTEVKT